MRSFSIVAGRSRRSRIVVRCRQEHALRCCQDGFRATKVRQKTSRVWRLPSNAPRKRPRYRFGCDPDHWHALPTIEALKLGMDVWVQKPISVDIIEGQAMLAAARKYGRVVQVGTQRRSTPHLIDAKKKVIDEGLLGKVSHAEVYCYYHMRARENPPDTMPHSPSRL